MNPAQICRRLEEQERQPSPRRRVDLAGHAAARRHIRNPIPLRPSEDTVREAEAQAAEAAHALQMADASCPAERLDELRRQAGEARARAHRLRHALDAA